jgi:hypothetical protein
MWSIDCIKVTYKHKGMYGSHPPSHKGKHQKVTLAYRLLVAVPVKVTNQSKPIRDMVTSPNVEGTNDLTNSSRGSGTPPCLYHTSPRAWPKPWWLGHGLSHLLGNSTTRNGRRLPTGASPSSRRLSDEWMDVAAGGGRGNKWTST